MRKTRTNLFNMNNINGATHCPLKLFLHPMCMCLCLCVCVCVWGGGGGGGGGGEGFKLSSICTADCTSVDFLRKLCSASMTITQSAHNCFSLCRFREATPTGSSWHANF